MNTTGKKYDGGKKGTPNKHIAEVKHQRHNLNRVNLPLLFLSIF